MRGRQRYRYNHGIGEYSECAFVDAYVVYQYSAYTHYSYHYRSYRYRRSCRITCRCHRCLAGKHHHHQWDTYRCRYV